MTDTITIPATATMEEAQRAIVSAALQRHGGNRYETAKALRVSRSTVYEWINRWGLGNGEDMTRRHLIDQAVIEAARHFMATSLIADRLGNRADTDAEIDAYERAAHASLDAMQELRDALSRHSAARRATGDRR